MSDVGEMVDEAWYIHKMEYYSTTKTYKGLITVWVRVHIRWYKR